MREQQTLLQPQEMTVVHYNKLQGRIQKILKGGGCGVSPSNSRDALIN